MKQMGIAQEEINAKRVVIETDGSNIIINNPSVVKINMQGQINFQISGEIEESDSYEDSEVEDDEDSDEVEEIDNTEEDIKTIMEQCTCIEAEARMALEKANGDLTQAIIDLG